MMTTRGNTSSDDHELGDADNVDKRRAEVRERKGLEREWQWRLERQRQRGGR
jgi:hypothetical protein